MILLANTEAAPGLATTISLLKSGATAVDAMVQGVGFVEADPKVRSVGYGGWPNVLGVMECDGAVMDGTTRDVGAVAAVPDTLHVAALAREVMRRLPHVMLTGAGARRFADEVGMPRADILHPDSKAVWWEKLAGLLNDTDEACFPDVPLIPLSTAITDPEKVRDTTVYLGQDKVGGVASVTSTSGWAWKYPGRVGDSPIPGAGYYADSRYGACACTHTGEMTMRCLTAHTVVEGLRHGLNLRQAVAHAVEDLRALTSGYLGEVVIHAIDTKGNHRVVTLQGPKPVPYWVWTPDMAGPERRISELAS